MKILSLFRLVVCLALVCFLACFAATAHATHARSHRASTRHTAARHPAKETTAKKLLAAKATVAKETAKKPTDAEILAQAESMLNEGATRVEARLTREGLATDMVRSNQLVRQAINASCILNEAKTGSRPASDALTSAEAFKKAAIAWDLGTGGTP